MNEIYKQKSKQPKKRLEFCVFMVLGKGLDCVGCHGLFFFTFFFQTCLLFLLSSLEKEKRKRKNGDGFFLLDRKREHLRRGTHHLQIAALVNSTKCQGIPGK